MSPEGDTRVNYGTKFAKMSGEKSETTCQHQPHLKHVIKIYILNYPWTKGTIERLLKPGSKQAKNIANLLLLCVITFTIDQKLIFQSGLFSSFFSFSQGSFSIEIRCSEYKTVTCCCQHSFPFFLLKCGAEILSRQISIFTHDCQIWLPSVKGMVLESLSMQCHSTSYSSSVIPFCAPRSSLI